MKKRSLEVESLILEYQERKKKRARRSITDVEAADWAALDDDLLRRIYTTLQSDLGDFVRFRAVCRGWRSFDSLLDHLPKTPWLLQCLYPVHAANTRLDPNLHFYSLASSHTGRIPAIEQYQCDSIEYYGPGNGYFLILRPNEDPCLLNPLTGNKILLPRLNLDTFNIHSLGFSGLNLRHEWYILSDNRRASEHDDWDVAWTCIIRCPNGNSWKYIELDIHTESCHTCRLGEMLFATDDDHGDVMVYDVISGEMLYQVGWPTDDDDSDVVSTHLVESSGDIFRVCLYYHRENSEGEPIYTDDIIDSVFEIYKLCSKEEGGRTIRSWVEVTDIGDRILFLDAVSGFSLNAPPGLIGNCIYYMPDGNPHRYDIGTGAVEEVPCPFNHCTSWFIPRLD